MLIMKTENRILSDDDYEAATKFLVAMWRLGVSTPRGTFSGRVPDDMLDDIATMVYRPWR